jgi:exosortase/archaeosortase family protein
MINTEEFTETQKKLFETLMFLTKLVAAGVVFRGILLVYPDTRLLQSLLASLINAMLNSSGIEAVREGIAITIGDTPYIITQDCLGWKSMAAFAGLVYASSKRTLEHLNFILQGFAVIIVANIIRVYSTVLLAEKGIFSFQIIHDFLWKWSLTLLVLIIWAYWFRKMKEREPAFQRKIKERVKHITSR